MFPRMFPRQSFIRLAVSLMLGMICLATVITAQTYQARAVRPVSVAGDLNDISQANDERVDTRANAGTASYAGMSITLDLGGQHNIIGVTQDHGRWPTNFPGAYKVEVAENADGPWMTTFEGAGHRGESRAVFAAVRGRFIRITATDTHGGADDWSIAEVRGGIDPGATNPRRIPARAPATEAAPRPRTEVAMRDINLAFDKDPNTRATTGRPDYAGATFVFDLGGEYELSRVVQIHGQWPDDFPAEYEIDVSRERNESKFREVWRGAGERERSVAAFAPVVTRYIRITALRARDDYHWWSIAELRTNRDRDTVERDEDDNLVTRSIRHVSGQGLTNAQAVSDDNNANRATTGTVNYAGSWIAADLGGSYTVAKVIQIHDPDERDFPGRYRIEVSEDGRNWRAVWTGQGERGRSVATFNPVRARFVRITAIANHDLEHWWSIYKLKIRG
jgi:hypothetical protein